MKNKVKTEQPAVYKIDNLTSVDPVIYSALSDTALLSIISGQDEQYCRDLLTKHDSLHGVNDKTDLLCASLELSKRYCFETIQRGEALCSPAQTRQYLQLQLGDYPHEVFACLFLDNRNRVISFEKLFHGTIDGASVYPREVVRAAINHNAAAVIFAHNHPSSVCEPSEADKKITKRLKDALALVDVRVLDHFIISDEVVSFAERGLL